MAGRAMRISNIQELPVPSEHHEQASFFRWLSLMAVDNPECGLAYAIPNGARTSIGVACKLKAEGLKSGVPDIFWPAPRYPYHGLYIEMKRHSGGKVLPEQKEWISRLRDQGYMVDVAKGFDDAKRIFCEYMALRRWRKNG